MHRRHGSSPNGDAHGARPGSSRNGTRTCIEGHNIFNFDLPYIIARCALQQRPFRHREGRQLRRASFDARTSFAEHPFEYTVTEIAGRHVIDTSCSSRATTPTKRTMESYGLKYVAKYFGFAGADRTYIEGEKISWYWDHEPQTLDRLRARRRSRRPARSARISPEAPSI